MRLKSIPSGQRLRLSLHFHAVVAILVRTYLTAFLIIMAPGISIFSFHLPPPFMSFVLVFISFDRLKI